MTRCLLQNRLLLGADGGWDESFGSFDAQQGLAHLRDTSSGFSRAGRDADLAVEVDGVNGVGRDGSHAGPQAPTSQEENPLIGYSMTSEMPQGMGYLQGDEPQERYQNWLQSLT